MVSSNLTSSATLHLRIGSFGGLFTLLVASFPPIYAFMLALVASILLAKM